VAAPSWQDLYDLGRYVLQVRRPTMVVNQGDVSDGFIAGTATMVDASIGENAARFRSTYLDGADGDDLTQEASDRATDRFVGVAAVGTVTFARASSAVGAGTLPVGYIVGTVQDASGGFSTYTINTAAVFGALDLTKSVDVTCTADGPQGNAQPGTVTRMIGGDVGAAFDPSITVNNAALFVGGFNQESDEDLRARAKGNFLNQVRGTESAVIAGARTVPQVKRASVVTDADTGVVTLYVSDADGNSNAAMVAAVAAVMPQWEPIDSIVNVVGASLLVVAIDISLTVKSGVDAAAIIDKIRSAIVSRLNLLNPGDTLYREMISTAAENVDKQNIVNVTVNTPAASIAPTTNQVIRTTTSSITTS
jgi:hypothetical protein